MSMSKIFSRAKKLLTNLIHKFTNVTQATYAITRGVMLHIEPIQSGQNYYRGKMRITIIDIVDNKVLLNNGDFNWKEDMHSFINSIKNGNTTRKPV